MREERLLERINVWSKEPERRGGNYTWRMVESVLNHLKRILNTRKGNVLIAEDYGVPDFTELLRAYPDSIRDLEKNIKHMIQKYEPRLKAVRLSFVPQDDDILSLHFRVEAKLNVDDENIPVNIETVLASDGKVDIKG